MKIIVQKFGGTSVTTNEKRNMAIDKVISASERGYSPVVVVSAMGRKGDPYATDTLLSLIDGSDSNVDKREIDLLMCCGEIISAVVMAEAFAKRGYKAKVLTGGNAGIITDANFGNAGIINVEAEKILNVLEQGLIPIVTGFQGITEEGDHTTLGRGGSDITGTLLGKALKAECVEIYTDVDGIMTADPNIVPGAKIINEISYSEVFQLADQGAKVVHPRAVEYALAGNIPLIIKNTVSDAPGTIITNSRGYAYNSVTGITSMANKTQIIINFPDNCRNMGNDIFELLAKKNINIDLVNIFPGQEIFTVDSVDASEVESILKQLCKEYRVINNCSKVSLIGNALRGMPEVMSKLLRTLECSNVNILQTSNSHTAIWCLIEEADNKKALNELHNAFFCASAS
ncbi:MAG: aspartate kinase [Clostridia bacterium BRH_c25]|nr:MAG: aspartate kinase [Clostridia bacterium BRH_c25]